MNMLDMQAQWIWCGGEIRPKNFYLYVRKSFSLSAEIRRARIRLTADSRYQLFVNGVFVARGPARCDRRWQCVDQWDIASTLQPGENVIAALVHHYGEWTFSYMLGRAGFLADIEVELSDGKVMRLGTDESWRVRPAAAWERKLPRMSIQLGYPEVYDSRKETQGWNSPLFDDSGWETATVLGPVGIEPWPDFLPREIPAMSNLPCMPAQVIDFGEVGNARTGHYIDLLRVVWNTSNAVAYLATFVWAPNETNAEIHAGSQEAIRLWVNGELLISHLVTRDPAPDQEIVAVQLKAGWNTVLAKIVQGEGQWHFYFRIEGNGSERLVYSSSRQVKPERADSSSAWWLIAPFESTDLQHGFESRYAPEDELDFVRSYMGKGGAEIRWISAGVTSESILTSVIMNREERFPHRGKAIENLDGLLGLGAPARVRPGPGHGCYAVIDFGEEVAGYPVIEVEGATGGEIIDLGYGEVMQMPDGEILRPSSGKIGILNPDRAGVHYADRYVCRAGRQRFQTFDKRAFRYLQLDVREVQQPLNVGPVSVILSTYPVEYLGRFSCSDTLLNRIWEVGRWTVQLNMEDAYTDCPWRERGQWWGDARVQALVNYYAFGDLKLVRNGLRQIAQSQTREGWTKGIYPTDWSYAILPTFTMLWVLSLWDYYEYSGDRITVKELFPAVELAMDCIGRFRGDHDLLRDVPHWLFVDWADVDTGGESASVNALYFSALRAAGALAAAVEQKSMSVACNDLANRVRAGMEKYLWDNGEYCFRDSLRNGGLSSKVSEQANCWAVAFGVASGETADGILEALFEKQLAAVRTGTPYFGFYVLNALAARGQYERSLGYIRKEWGKMLEWGATTWWEQWEPKASFCHGWSSGPTCFLQSEILGVRPAKPGWEEILIAPHPAGLQWADGKVPTPHGVISVRWEAGGEFAVQAEIPAPAIVTVPRMKNGVVTINVGRENRPVQANCLPDRSGHIAIVLSEPGTYRVLSS
jgi:hypothetical protein